MGVHKICPTCLCSVELTPREQQVCRLLAAGKVVKDIANLWNLSYKTVEVHKYNVFKKLGVHDQYGLKQAAIAKGLDVTMNTSKQPGDPS